MATASANSVSPGGKKLTPGDFEVIRLIGTGNFSEVFQVQRIVSKEEKMAVRQRRIEGKVLPTDGVVNFAMKKIIKARLKQLHKEPEVLMEKHCLTKLNNYSNQTETGSSSSDREVVLGQSNIIQLYWTFQDDEALYLIMEFCPEGELWDMVVGIGLLDERLAKYYIAQFVNAVEFVHRNGIVHRDLKAENLLVDRHGILKLIDFGTAIDLDRPDIKTAGNRGRGTQCKVFDHFIGTAQFMAPEVIRNQESGRPSDLWSMGCTIYQILAGIPPFDGPSEFLVFLLSTSLDYEFPPHFPPLAQDLVAALLQLDPTERLSADHSDLSVIRAHPYFEGIDFSNLRQSVLAGRDLGHPPLRDACFSHMSKHWARWKLEWMKIGWLTSEGLLNLLTDTSTPEVHRPTDGLTDCELSVSQSWKSRLESEHVMHQQNHQTSSCPNHSDTSTSQLPLPGTNDAVVNWDLPAVGVNLELKCKELMKVEGFGKRAQERRAQERLLYLQLIKDFSGGRKNQTFWDDRVQAFLQKQDAEKKQEKSLGNREVKMEGGKKEAGKEESEELDSCEDEEEETITQDTDSCEEK